MSDYEYEYADSRFPPPRAGTVRGWASSKPRLVTAVEWVGHPRNGGGPWNESYFHASKGYHVVTRPATDEEIITYLVRSDWPGLLSPYVAEARREAAEKLARARLVAESP